MKKQLYLFILSVFFISGCASVRHVVPPDRLNDASVFGIRDIRAFSGSPSDLLKNDFIKLLEQEKKDPLPLFNFNTPRTYYMLAISGGAANGAYGAGLLGGWSKSGTRPVFKIVTGISTGAVIAPLAFLGSKYDVLLKEFYTKYRTRDIVRFRFPMVNSFASTRPLERLIDKYFTAELIKDIATEYKNGRRLYVGTTNLDAQRLVIWDMGKIAASGSDKALKLFRKIILASSSIPVAFPPVYLSVNSNDQVYDEMHVDGGVTKQVFFLYDVLQGFDKALKEEGLTSDRNRYGIYVIRNGYVDPVYKEVPDKLPAIAERAIDTMTNAQSMGDIYQIYVYTKNGRGDFNLACIPADYVFKPKELFDPVAMNALYDLGFKEAAGGYPWRKSPTGYED